MGCFSMGVAFENYELGYRIASLAFDEAARDKLAARGLPFVYFAEGGALLYPEGIRLDMTPESAKVLLRYGNYDVCSIYDDGTLRIRYSDRSSDNYFFITGRCNSNCVMCPSPEGSRRGAPEANLADLTELAAHIPSDAPHLTITGGEPFMAGEKLFEFIDFLKTRFPVTEFLLLTNGRIFAVDKYVRMLKETMPRNILVAVPVHGSCPAIHDSITRVEGSFEQTRRGVRSLLRSGIPVEIRLVVNRLNAHDFGSIADLVTSQFRGVDHVSVMAMEMTGSARVNRDEVWMPYRESFSAISGALRKMVESGVDVRLYNFPLCTVDRPFWPLCEKSISTSKVRFSPSCESCAQKASCGGVFAGTYSMVKDEMRALP